MKPVKPMKPLAPITRGSEAARTWWPHELGSPTTTGSSNDLRYAYFPDKHCLAVDDGQRVKVYDTGGQSINGFSSSDGKALTFHSESGPRKVSSLKLI